MANLKLCISEATGISPIHLWHFFSFVVVNLGVSWTDCSKYNGCYGGTKYTMRKEIHT